MRAAVKYVNVFVESHQRRLYEKILDEKLDETLLKQMDRNGDNRVDILEYLECSLYVPNYSFYLYHHFCFSFLQLNLSSSDTFPGKI